MSRKPGKTIVREAITNPEPAPPAPNDPPPGPPESFKWRYPMLENGLHLRRKTDDGEVLHPVSAPFTIEAETLDEAGQWGLLISWLDRNSAPRSEVFSRESFAGDCRDLRSRLAAGGLTMSGETRARQAFGEYLNRAWSPERARCVSRTGWHHIKGRRVFVLPDQVIGKPPERIIPPKASPEENQFRQAGTLAAWLERIGALAVFNSRLAFVIAAAFAGPLLEITGEDGGGFNLKGASRVGKTTALRVAASVWGGSVEQGAAGYVRSWRATSSGLESVAALYSDQLLCLDEMGQLNGAESGEVAYMLANGSGKSRAGRDGQSRTASRWRVLFLSTGELGLADKNAEARKTTKAGQEVRLVDVEADAGAGFGLFEQLHDHESADAFAEALRSATRDIYGVAGSFFLGWLLDQMARDPGFIAAIRTRIEALVAQWLALVPDAGGQVRSVARRFALVAVAGELASKAMITGWRIEESSDAARILFDGWLGDRGTAGAAEDRNAVTQLAAFIGRHGASRFVRWTAKNDLPLDEELPPDERQKTMDRAGWKQWIVENGRGHWIYMLMPHAMREALEGLDFNRAIKVLVQQGNIIPGKKRDDKPGKTVNQQDKRPPGEQKMKLYVLSAQITGETGATSE
jgi:putative DNA primase/helicase